MCYLFLLLSLLAYLGLLYWPFGALRTCFRRRWLAVHLFACLGLVCLPLRHEGFLSQAVVRAFSEAGTVLIARAPADEEDASAKLTLILGSNEPLRLGEVLFAIRWHHRHAARAFPCPVATCIYSSVIVVVTIQHST